ncbi:rhamnan synthesis F family protein [Schaalia suimastitidis]|uniref:rhamnan synthesis F family protein n=1 Tax=Schaalia suimastitidis TaxID=121163 RepID=UPI00041A4C99|nr:rhamnan synthesis F family protein [Schaalia suimastitidis]
MILTGTAKRLGIFFFYDAAGQVDTFVEALLGDMLKNLSELAVVVNGNLTEEGYRTLCQYTSNVTVRDNRGLDVWAYKTVLDSYGWSRLSSDFDEIVLFNCTIMGPVYPFGEMFSEMAGRDVDFWGVTAFHGIPSGSTNVSSIEEVPWHIQSHFHVYRRSLVSSKEFQAYWDSVPIIKDYADSVAKHEKPFTQRFTDLGFVCDVYVDTRDLENITSHPIIFAPTKLIAERRCPIFKRRSFFHDYEDVLDQAIGNAALDLYEYLRDHTTYDTGMIWENLLRTVELTDLVKNLQLTYVLPTRVVEVEPQHQKIALIMHVHYMELMESMLHYARSMPEYADIIVTVGADEKVRYVSSLCSQLPNKVIVRKVKNRGRDVSALLVGTCDLVQQYDLVCFVHDKKVTQIQPGTVGEGFALKCFDNVLATPAFVANVIATFEKEPRLGLLTPMPPNHADYFPISAYAWGPNFQRTEQLLGDLGVSVPVHEEKGLIAPLGSTFWFRPKALQKLFDKGWEWNDFPPEPLAGDGTISHAIERSHCYVAQGAGYFSAWLFSDRFARIELTNLSFYTRELTRAMSDHWNLAKQVDMVRAAKASTSTWKVLRAGFKRRTPPLFHGPARVALGIARNVRSILRRGKTS